MTGGQEPTLGHLRSHLHPECPWPPLLPAYLQVWHPNISSATGAICLGKVKTGVHSTLYLLLLFDPSCRPAAIYLLAPIPHADILKDNWSPALTLKTAMLSLQALLACPEPKDPQDAVVAKQYMSDPQAFNREAREWTRTYADPNKRDEKVESLVEMGFDRCAKGMWLVFTAWHGSACD